MLPEILIIKGLIKIYENRLNLGLQQALIDNKIIKIIRKSMFDFIKMEM